MYFRRYWDNVAGPTLDAALLNFNYDGLIIVRPLYIARRLWLLTETCYRLVELSVKLATTTAASSGCVNVHARIELR